MLIRGQHRNQALNIPPTHFRCVAGVNRQILLLRIGRVGPAIKIRREQKKHTAPHQQAAGRAEGVRVKAVQRVKHQRTTLRAQ